MPAKKAPKATPRTPKRPKTATPKVQVRTPNVPGYTGSVDAAKYRAMKAIVLKVIPRKAPGVTQNEMMAAIGERKDEATFPGTTHTWWGKTVQLDLEAQGIVARDGGKPLRWRRVA